MVGHLGGQTLPLRVWRLGKGLPQAQWQGGKDEDFAVKKQCLYMAHFLLERKTSL
jgi:hypothetical protein